jgi:hypothetical protein
MTMTTAQNSMTIQSAGWPAAGPAAAYDDLGRSDVLSVHRLGTSALDAVILDTSVDGTTVLLSVHVSLHCDPGFCVLAVNGVPTGDDTEYTAPEDLSRAAASEAGGFPLATAKRVWALARYELRVR